MKNHDNFGCWLLVVGLCLTARAEPLSGIYCNQKNTWIDTEKCLTEKTDGVFNVLQIKGVHVLLSQPMLEIKSGKSYKLSGYFRKGKNSPDSLFYFGVACYDKNKKVIGTYNFVTVPKTETELVAPCHASEQVVKVKDAAKWQRSKYLSVVFQIDDSGKFADLPNDHIALRGIEKVEAEKNYYKVTMGGNSDRDYPAGTKVRLHTDSATFAYAAADRQVVPNDWQEFSAVIASTATNAYDSSQWFNGTSYAKIVIMANYDDHQDGIMEFRDIVLTEEP